MKRSHVRTLLRVALLIAADVVLTRFFSINAPTVRIGLGFAPIAVCAMLYGPLWAGGAAALADFLGAVLFPTGPFFPGLTLSAALTGVIFGLLLHRRGEGWLPLGGAVVLNCLGVGFLLNTYWLSILMKTPFLVLLPTRVFQALLMTAVQLVVIRSLRRPVRRYMDSGER